MSVRVESSYATHQLPCPNSFDQFMDFLELRPWSDLFTWLSTLIMVWPLQTQVNTP